MQAKLTKRVVDEAKPRVNDLLIWDTQLKGFGLKVTPSGKKVYLFQYRIGGRAGRTRRVTIGQHGSPWTPDKARQEAEQHSISVKRGVDPQSNKQSHLSDAVTLAFDRYMERFIEQYLAENWVRHQREGARLLRREAKPHFGSTPLTSITKRDVTALFDHLKARPGIAAGTSRVLRKLFNWAVERGELAVSPMDRIALPKAPQSRRRYLGDAELAALWRATLKLDHPYGRLVRCLIVLGQRRDEVAGMTWDEVDLSTATWTIPGERAKNGKAHKVPVPLLALTDMKAGGGSHFVFSVSGDRPIQNWSYWKNRIDILFAEEAAAAGMQPPADWRLHDLRRSVATGMQRMGVHEDVVEAFQNRQVRGGMSGTYQVHEYESERRPAAQCWADHVEQLVSAASTA